MKEPRRLAALTRGNHSRRSSVSNGVLPPEGYRRENVNWRRRRDSNPRYAFEAYNGLANRRLQPLGHVSVRLDMPDSDSIGKQMAPNPPFGAPVQCAGQRTFSSPAASRARRAAR